MEAYIIFKAISLTLDIWGTYNMDGMITCYETEAVEVLSPYAVGEMTAGEYDLTFFTCTYGGQGRVTVRCMRAEKE